MVKAYQVIEKMSSKLGNGFQEVLNSQDRANNPSTDQSGFSEFQWVRRSRVLCLARLWLLGMFPSGIWVGSRSGWKK